MSMWATSRFVLHGISASTCHIFLVRAPCSWAVFAIIITSVAFISRRAVISWCRNIRSCLFDIMDILLQGVCYFRWMLFASAIYSLLVLTCSSCLGACSSVGLSRWPRGPLVVLLLNHTSYRGWTPIVRVSILVVGGTLLRSAWWWSVVATFQTIIYFLNSLRWWMSRGSSLNFACG